MTKTDNNHLEEAIAHHEKQIHDLSDMVAAQWDIIEALQRKVKRLQDKMGVLEDSVNMDDEEGLSVTEKALRDKPPHY